MAPRTQAEIEAELAAARDRLSANVAALVGEVHPRLVAHRTIEVSKQDVKRGLVDAKQSVVDGAAAAKSWLTDTAEWLLAEAKARLSDEHGLRWDRVAAVGAAVLATGGLVAVLSHRKH